MSIRWIFAITLSLSSLLPAVVMAQPRSRGLFGDIIVVEKESAEAKKVRLEWISEERNRIRAEMQQYGSELAKLREDVPDEVNRVQGRAVADERRRDKIGFNNFAQNNNIDLRNAVFRGGGLNVLLKVLGPIAHYRRIRTNGAQVADGGFESLSPTEKIEKAELEHYRLNPATSGGSKVVVRLNQLPLTLEWPEVVILNWGEDRRNIEKARDAFVELLGSGKSDVKFLECAELLDNHLELLQAKILQKKRLMPGNTAILDAGKRMRLHGELNEANRYIESVRATAERFRRAPSDYKVRQFEGGNIEEFLDLCYTHGMIFQEAKPEDQEYYQKIYRRMQDYARDVQDVEDLKDNLKRRIAELKTEDQELIVRASEQ